MKKINTLVSTLLIIYASCQEPSTDENDTDGNEIPVSPIDTIRFSDISNILKNNCYECHSVSGFTFYGLNLDSYKSTMTGSQNGTIVKPFDPYQSLLYTKCTQDFPKNSDFVPNTHMLQSIQTSFYCPVEKLIYLKGTDYEDISCSKSIPINEGSEVSIYRNKIEYKPINSIFLILNFISIVYLAKRKKLFKYS